MGRSCLKCKSYVILFAIIFIVMTFFSVLYGGTDEKDSLLYYNDWYYGGEMRMESLGGIKYVLKDITSIIDLYTFGFSSGIIARKKKNYANFNVVYGPVKAGAIDIDLHQWFENENFINVEGSGMLREYYGLKPDLKAGFKYARILSESIAVGLFCSYEWDKNYTWYEGTKYNAGLDFSQKISTDDFLREFDVNWGISSSYSFFDTRNKEYYFKGLSLNTAFSLTTKKMDFEIFCNIGMYAYQEYYYAVYDTVDGLLHFAGYKLSSRVFNVSPIKLNLLTRYSPMKPLVLSLYMDALGSTNTFVLGVCFVGDAFNIPVELESDGKVKLGLEMTPAEWTSLRLGLVWGDIGFIPEKYSCGVGLYFGQWILDSVVEINLSGDDYFIGVNQPINLGAGVKYLF